MSETGQQTAAGTYRVAADHFVRIVDGIAPDQWDAPGLGDWDIRALVGHTARALVTVRDYLKNPPTELEVTSPAAYFTAAKAVADPEAIKRRGIDAGAGLGADPAATVATLAGEALAAIAVPDRTVATPFGGMLLSDYLPTRTFELAVHGLDLTRASGQRLPVPPEVLASALATAAAAAAQQGGGEALLLALCGRTGLAAGFAVV